MIMQQIRARARAMQITPGSKDKTTLIRSIQKKEGNFHCFKTAVAQCDQLACCWRTDCNPGSSPAPS